MTRAYVGAAFEEQVMAVVEGGADKTVWLKRISKEPTCALGLKIED